MTSCAHCPTPVDPATAYFSEEGDLLCQRCFGRQQVQVNEQRLEAEAAYEAHVALGIIPTGPGAPGTAPVARQPSSKAGVGAGLFLILASLLLLVAGLSLDRFYIYTPVMLLIGIAITVRGLRTRRAAAPVSLMPRPAPSRR
jgi:hypothetical protein